MKADGLILNGQTKKRHYKDDDDDDDNEKWKTEEFK